MSTKFNIFYLGWVLGLIFTSQTSINIKSHKAKQNNIKRNTIISEVISKKFFVGSEFWVLLILIINLGCYTPEDLACKGARGRMVAALCAVDVVDELAAFLGRDAPQGNPIGALTVQVSVVEAVGLGIGRASCRERVYVLV